MGDTLYVADWGNKRVVALTTDLTFKFSFRKGADAMEPCGIAASDKELFVSDQAAHQLHVFSPTGEFLRSIGANGTQPGQFKSPCGVTCIGGILFVAEYVGRRVQALETDGTPLQVLPVADATSLYDLCVVRPQPRTAGCTLYVTDFATEELHVLSLEMERLMTA
jgi:sugar lactone lactonase YvrE